MNPETFFFQEFRSAYLCQLLKDYFAVFGSYLKDVNIETSFEEFSKEFYERRDFMLSFGALVNKFAEKF